MTPGMNRAPRTHRRPPARILPHAIALLSLTVALAGCMHGEDGNGQVTSLRFDEHPELGSILVDGDGNTLYIFENDEPGTSNCFDDCADNWPPLIADEPPETAAGLEDQITLIDREGEQQVAHDDRPLYYFQGDQEPGDANGEGIGEVWFVVREESQ